MRSFREFLDVKQREAMRHLNILHNVLEKNDFKVKKFLGRRFDESYIYVFNPEKNTSFAGVRLYKLGPTVCYRVQREEDTHPYGTAYSLDVEMIFDDLKEDGLQEGKLGPKLVEELVRELKAFFKESAKAEKEEQEAQEGGQGQIFVKNPLGGDYSNMVNDKSSGGGG